MLIEAAQIVDAAVRWGLGVAASGCAEGLAVYGNLLLQWNARFNLTAIRDEEELIERHLMEGVFAAAYHPAAKTALDLGSGTGIPGIPIAMCHRDLHVTLAESQRKKAAFLSEAIRRLHLHTSIHPGRAETLSASSFDAVWMRAVDKSAAMLPVAVSLLAPGGSLCLFGAALPPQLPDHEMWQWKSHPLPGSNTRVLHIGTRK